MAFKPRNPSPVGKKNQAVGHITWRDQWAGTCKRLSIGPTPRVEPARAERLSQQGRESRKRPFRSSTDFRRRKSPPLWTGKLSVGGPTNRILSRVALRPKVKHGGSGGEQHLANCLFQKTVEKVLFWCASFDSLNSCFVASFEIQSLSVGVVPLPWAQRCLWIMFTELKVQSVTAGRQAGRRDEGKASEEKSGGNKQRDAVFGQTAAFARYKSWTFQVLLRRHRWWTALPERTRPEGWTADCFKPCCTFLPLTDTFLILAFL